MMLSAKTFVLAALAGAAISSAPALAVVTTFAQFEAVGSTSNIRWVNSGTTASSGTGGSLFTIASQASTVVGTRLVNFSFLQPSIVPFVTDISALFTLNSAAPSGNRATLSSGILVQPGIAGSFSFVTVDAITINSRTFAAGSNLLTGTFDAASIVGQRRGSAGSASASSLGGSNITYTSDFLSFDAMSNFDFAISLTAITSVLQATPTTGIPTNSLRSFRASAVGSFSADPAPIVTAVPEPAVWGMMIVGFGMVGMQTRRRARKTVAA